MIAELGCTESEGYKQYLEQVQTNAKLEKNIALEKERLKILLGKVNPNWWRSWAGGGGRTKNNSEFEFWGRYLSKMSQTTYYMIFFNVNELVGYRESERDWIAKLSLDSNSVPAKKVTKNIPHDFYRFFKFRVILFRLDPSPPPHPRLQLFLEKNFKKVSYMEGL